MSRMFTAVSALAILASAPAIAQDMQSAPAPTEPATVQADPMTPAPEASVNDAAPATGASASTKAEQVAAVVETEFPSYDTDKDGDLTKTEFASWMTALKQKTEPTADAAKTMKWVNDAFASADADKSKKISKAEMSSFLLG